MKALFQRVAAAAAMNHLHGSQRRLRIACNSTRSTYKGNRHASALQVSCNVQTEHAVLTHTLTKASEALSREADVAVGWNSSRTIPRLPCFGEPPGPRVCSLTDSTQSTLILHFIVGLKDGDRLCLTSRSSECRYILLSKAENVIEKSLIMEIGGQSSEALMFFGFRIDLSQRYKLTVVAHAIENPI